MNFNRAALLLLLAFSLNPSPSRAQVAEPASDDDGPNAQMLRDWRHKMATAPGPLRKQQIYEAFVRSQMKVLDEPVDPRLAPDFRRREVVENLGRITPVRLPSYALTKLVAEARITIDRCVIILQVLVENRTVMTDEQIEDARNICDPDDEQQLRMFRDMLPSLLNELPRRRAFITGEAFDRAIVTLGDNATFAQKNTLFRDILLERGGVTPAMKNFMAERLRDPKLPRDQRRDFYVAAERWGSAQLWDLLEVPDVDADLDDVKKIVAARRGIAELNASEWVTRLRGPVAEASKAAALDLDALASADIYAFDVPVRAQLEKEVDRWLAFYLKDGEPTKMKGAVAEALLHLMNAPALNARYSDEDRKIMTDLTNALP